MLQLMEKLKVPVSPLGKLLKKMTRLHKFCHRIKAIISL
ncbi:Secretion permease [Mannheimia varigena USDA-ARS-USMARC-1388]|nr:Secretion permease [Mannheimia varigena USDA-ARS-USMARC-1388]